jgi:hypothetical protein
MGIVSPVITAYFDLDSQDDTLFTIEDPVLGLLDTGGVLGGDLAEDVSGYGFEIAINRGRSIELDEITTGTCRATMRNHTRDWDPSYAAGPFFGNLVPGKKLEVSIYGVTIYTGSIDDIADDYPISGGSAASLLAIDALGDMARVDFDEWTTTSQLPGARITAVLDRDEVRYAGGRDLDDGIETLQADLVSWGSNVLNYLQLVAKTDLGRLFASRTGVLTFRDRLADVDTAPTLTFSDVPSAWLALEGGDEFLLDSDDPLLTGSGYAFSGVSKRTAAELLATIVSVDREGGIAQTVTSEAGITAYRPRRLSLSGLLLNDDTRSLDMANFLLGIYGTPEDRIAGLMIIVSGLDNQADQALVSGLELGDTVNVGWTPNSVGDPVERVCVVEGVSHQISVHGVHTMTLALSEVLQSGLFTIEDDVLGLLDVGGSLAF